MNLTKSFLAACALLLFSVSAQSANAAVVRFDDHYFFQSEEVMLNKGIQFKELARYSTKLQSQIWKALVKAQLPVTRGYIVIAIRSDGAVASWLDMQPAMHEYYAYAVTEAVKKVPAPSVSKGALVFAIKMSINTAVHTKQAVPAPEEWKDARKKLGDTQDIEAIVFTAWPEE
jgi:hypothetical protein